MKDNKTNVRCCFDTIISSIHLWQVFPSVFGPWHWFVLILISAPTWHSWHSFNAMVFRVVSSCVSFVLVFRIPHQSILMRLNDPIVLSFDLRMVWNFCCSVWARPSRCEDLNLTLLNLAWRLALVYLHAIGLVFNSPSLVKITCHDVLVYYNHSLEMMSPI